MDDHARHHHSQREAPRRHASAGSVDPRALFARGLVCFRLTRASSMYKKILVALENGRADETLVPHIASLARQLGSELLLVHVADGWAARNFQQLKLAESDEMKADRAYLEQAALRLRADSLPVT